MYHLLLSGWRFGSFDTIEGLKKSIGDTPFDCYQIATYGNYINPAKLEIIETGLTDENWIVEWKPST